MKESTVFKTTLRIVCKREEEKKFPFLPGCNRVQPLFDAAQFPEPDLLGFDHHLGLLVFLLPVLPDSLGDLAGLGLLFRAPGHLRHFLGLGFSDQLQVIQRDPFDGIPAPLACGSREDLLDVGGKLIYQLWVSY